MRRTAFVLNGFTRVFGSISERSGTCKKRRGPKLYIEGTEGCCSTGSESPELTQGKDQRSADKCMIALERATRYSVFMQAVAIVRRTIYKTIFKRLLARFVVIEQRVKALERVSASLEKRLLASARKQALSEESSVAMGIELAQLSSLLEIKGTIPPIPPGHLQFRVSGAHSPNFFRQGAALLRDIEALVAAQGRTLESFENVLDFGCGCGRILIPLTFRLPGSRLNGCDIDPEAIQWCKANLVDCRSFRLNGPLPPMDFADRQFDFIFGVSVFTHLPEEMQFKWLDDLFRVTAPGGLVIMTFHGAPHYGGLRPKDRAKLDAHGFLYSDTSVGSTAGLPDFYQTSWHTHPYVRKHWGAKFEVVDVLEGAIANHDVAVLRRPA